MTDYHGTKWRVRKMINGKSYTLTFDKKPSKSDIELALAEKISTYKAGSSDTFESCLKHYLNVNSNVLSPNTIKNYSCFLRNIPEEIKESPVNEITEDMVQSFINNYSVNHAPKTTANMNALVSLVMRKYGKRQYIINLPQKRNTDDYMPSEEDIQKIYRECKDTEFEIAFLLASFGLRRSEICALTPDDIKDGFAHITKTVYYDTKAKEWKVKPYPKNSSSERYASIPPRAEEIVREKGYVYKYSPNRCYKSLQSILKKLGIPPFRFHQLRSYYASAAHAEGIPDVYIMKNGGWSTDDTLKRVYRRTLSDRQKEMDAKFIQHIENAILSL